VLIFKHKFKSVKIKSLEIKTLYERGNSKNIIFTFLSDRVFLSEYLFLTCKQIIKFDKTEK
jgi:hypothetical protein